MLNYMFFFFLCVRVCSSFDVVGLRNQGLAMQFDVCVKTE